MHNLISLSAFVVVQNQYNFIDTTLACVFLFALLYGTMREGGLLIAFFFCKLCAEGGVQAPWAAFALVFGVIFVTSFSK